MIDWVWMPNRKSTNKKWIEAEKKLYTQLMDEAFPGEDKLTKIQDTAYSRKAIDRCWKTIRNAAKKANPKCIIWLTTNKIDHPHVIDSDMYREVDWLMGEKGNLEEIEKVKSKVGKNTKLITCLASWNGADATKAVPQALKSGIGLYGFGRPRDRGGVIDLDKIFPKQLSQLSGNNRNIAVLARAYQGKTIDAIWTDEKFAEPKNPPAFRIKFRGRRGFSDTAHVSFSKEKAVIVITNPYQSGRSQLTRVGDKWPSSIVIQLQSKSSNTPAPSHFRIANGKIGISIIQKAQVEVIAGETEESLNLKTAWTTQKFLNGGKPSSPIKIDSVKTEVNEKYIEITLPKEIIKSNPTVLTFEWCNGIKVR